MKIHLVKKQSIEDFITEHRNSISSFKLWLSAIKTARWNIPEDIKKSFNSADILGKGCNRVVFDIAGNRYRMICKYTFGEKEVHLFICWLGTHAEYDKICAKKEQFTINIYKSK